MSPYDYGDDNSIRNIDPDGMETEDANDDPPGSHGSIIQPTNPGYRLMHPDLAAIHDVAYKVLDAVGVVDLVNSVGDVGDKNISTKDKAGHIFQAAAGVFTLGEEGESEGFHGEGPKINIDAPGGPKSGSEGGPGAGKRFSNKVKTEVKAEANGKCILCGDKTDTGAPVRKGILIILYQNQEMVTIQKRMLSTHVKIVIN